MFTRLLNFVIKDTDEQPDGEIHRARSEKVPSAGASVPMELGCITLPLCINSPIWKPSEPHTIRILWRLAHLGITNY